MLLSINKIHGLGVFGAYAPKPDLPEFARFNVIYGENGSGKTTLSRLFSALENGSHPDHPDLTYTVLTQNGSLTQGQKYHRKVRVFNSDYVEANIGLDGPLRHILIIGEENKQLAEEIAAEQATLDDRSRLIAAATSAIGKLESERGKVFSAIAKTIGEAISGSTLRSYRKPAAEVAFQKNADPKKLTDEQLNVHRATIHQEQMEAIQKPTVPTV